MTTPAPPQRWLAGWFHFPPPYERFTGRGADATSWKGAQAWLSQQLLEHVSQWGPLTVGTMHRRPEPPFDLLSFSDHADFVEHGLPLRQDRGVWASDGERCFYIIRDDTPAASDADTATEGTPPLHMSLPPIVPQFLQGEPLPVRHIAPALVPTG